MLRRLNKLLNGEIAFGFFVAGVFWLAVFGWAMSYLPTTAEKKDCYDSAAKSGRDTRDCESFWEKTTSEPIALFTLVLAFSTVGLWVATIGLYRRTRDQLRHAEETSIRQLQAYVGVHQMKATIEALGGTGIKVFVSVILKNFGQTPAIIDHVHVQTGLVVAKAGFAALNTDRREILPDAEIETMVEGRTDIYSDLKTDNLSVVTRFRYEDFTRDIHTRDVESHAVIEIPPENLGPFEVKLHNVRNIDMPHDRGIWAPSSQSYWDIMKRKKPNR